MKLLLEKKQIIPVASSESKVFPEVELDFIFGFNVPRRWLVILRFLSRGTAYEKRPIAR